MTNSAEINIQQVGSRVHEQTRVGVRDRHALVDLRTGFEVGQSSAVSETMRSFP